MRPSLSIVAVTTALLVASSAGAQTAATIQAQLNANTAAMADAAKRGDKTKLQDLQHQRANLLAAQDRLARASSR